MEQFFDDYEILEDLGRRNKNRYYLVRCKKCGNQKEIGINNLKKQDNHHSARNCGLRFYECLVGRIFGDYIVKEIIPDEKRGFLAKMACIECGHTVFCHAGNVKKKYHNGVSCRDDFHRSIVGKVFGDLSIEKIIGKKNDQTTYDCRCLICGVRSERTASSIKKGIKHGAQCIKQIPDSDIKRAVIQRWNNMYNRCNNPNNSNYPYYGGRGIKLMYNSAVELYLDFYDELKKHAEKYGVENSTFDRIDVNGNYEKDNLRITTQKVQSTNTTRRKLFIIKKEEQIVLSDSAMECGRVFGVSGRSLGNVIRGASKSCGGWTLVKIVEPDSDLEEIIKVEGVTTKLIVSDDQRGVL